MIDYEQFLQIRHLHDQKGLKPSQIADKMGIDPRTAIRWVAAKKFIPRQSPARQSKLDPFKNEIIRMIDFHPYTAAQILERIREKGFVGGYTIVKDYLTKIRPKKKPAYLTLSFAPGECAQVDWGSYGSVTVGDTHRKLSFFVMVLCYSRMMYVEFTVSQTMEHFLGCHQRAFNILADVSKKLWWTISSPPCCSALSVKARY